MVADSSLKPNSAYPKGKHDKRLRAKPSHSELPGRVRCRKAPRAQPRCKSHRYIRSSTVQRVDPSDFLSGHARLLRCVARSFDSLGVAGLGRGGEGVQ